MEDDLKILNVEYLSNHWILLKFKSSVLVTIPKFTNALNEDDLQWKTNSNERQSPVEEDLQWKTS